MNNQDDKIIDAALKAYGITLTDAIVRLNQAGLASAREKEAELVKVTALIAKRAEQGR